MIFREILNLNFVLVTALIGWVIAQVLKVMVVLIQSGELNWVLLFEPGGMPSSHSSMISAAAFSLGLTQGFQSPMFALGTVLAMIVIYDATGIRYQAGKHAELLNQIMTDISKGKFAQQKRLQEVLGHTPGEAILGTILGIVVAEIIWLAAG